MSSTPYQPPTYLTPRYCPGELYGNPLAPIASITGQPGPYVPVDYVAASYLPPELVGNPLKILANPILFSNELANFLRMALINPSPGKLPQSAVTYPQMRFLLIEGDEDLLSSGPCGLAYRRYQIDCLSPKYAEAETLAERLRLLLRTFRGPMGRAWIDNVVRHQVAALVAAPANGSDSSATHRFISEFTFWFRQ